MYLRVPVTDTTDPDLTGFLAAHRLPDLPADPDYLIQLSGGPNYLADIWRDSERVLVAVLIDTCASNTDAGEFLVLAASDAPIPNDAFLIALATLENQAMKGPRGNLEIGLTKPIEAQRAMLEARSYKAAYALHNMTQPRSAHAAQPVMPQGWHWADVTDDNRRDLFDLLHDAFTGIPGTQIPEWESFRSRKPSADRQQALLLIDDKPAAFISLIVEGNHGEINTIGRAAKFRGLAIGDILIAESLYRLTQAGVETIGLMVATTNATALDLYRRHWFALANSVDVVSKPVRFS